MVFSVCICLHFPRSDYCYLTYPESDDWAETDFPCSDECAIKFYKNAHEQPGSNYFFSYFSLGNQTSWWEETFAGGWKTVVQCGEGGNDVSSTTGSSIKTDIVDISTPTSSISAKATISPTTTTTTTAAPVQSESASESASGSPSGSASGSTSTIATSGASRPRAFLF